MRNLRFAHKVENHSRRLVYDKLMVFISNSANIDLYIEEKELNILFIIHFRKEEKIAVNINQILIINKISKINDQDLN